MNNLIFVDIIYNICKEYDLKVGYLYENEYQCAFSVSRPDKQGYNIIIEKTVWKKDYPTEESFKKEFTENFKHLIKNEKGK
jgi:hypothetical protein